VDSFIVIAAFRVFVKEGRFPLANAKIYSEGQDCGLNKDGRLRTWPRLLDIYDGLLDRLLTPNE
jgi:hypothetical protein